MVSPTALLLLLLVSPLPTTSFGQSGENRGDKRAEGSKCGPLSGQVFRCPTFAFSVKVPFGWVDRSEQMRATSESASEGSAQKLASSSRSEVLLAVFEHPPEVVGETINRAIVISVERTADYPAIKSASDYFGPLTDVAGERGFRLTGEPYALVRGAQRLMRGNFSRQQGKLTMWQSSLVMIENRSILLFTLIAASEQEVDDLIAQLNFYSATRK